MAYKKGELRVVVCTHTDPDVCICNNPFDARGDYERRLGGVAYLPHSCDSWVIGGPEEVRVMIADLQAALEEMKEGTTTKSDQ